MIEDKANVSDLCRWMLGLFESRTSIRYDFTPSTDWATLCRRSQELIGVCEKFLLIWNALANKIFQYIQSTQHYPSSKYAASFVPIFVNYNQAMFCKTITRVCKFGEGQCSCGPGTLLLVLVLKPPRNNFHSLLPGTW
jgi:hypothetical protein